MIEFKDVCFKYKDIDVLKNVTVNIGEGESVALIGANGSGKSTFLKLLNGIVFSQKGKYYFEKN
jgi:cobalt/nickel transport system ATP-binding protein